MNPLDQLKDIHIPSQISTWPPAYGWWLVAFFILLVVIVIITAWIKHRQYNAARRHALNELASITSSQADWPIRMNTLLKRVCMHYLPSEQHANLHSKRWQAYLCEQLPSSKQGTFNAAFSALQTQLYRPATADSTQFSAIQAQVSVWIKHAKLKDVSESSSTGAAHV